MAPYAQPDPYTALDPDATVTGPPTTPVEQQQRVSGWQRLLTQMQTDPTLAAGIFRFATQVMQPINPGQSRAGHFAGALEDSVNYAAASRSLRAEEARKASLAESEVGLRAQQGAHAAAQTADIEAKTPGAVGLQDALTKLYGSHAKYYELLGQAAEQKANAAGVRQLLHSTTIENADGTKTLVNTHAVNGKLYIDSTVMPRFTDESMAKLQAQKDVDKITPFFGKAPYEGTKADEVRRRTALYLNGKRTIAGPGGQALTPQQFEAVDQTPNTSGKQISAGERGIQRDVNMTPEERAADEAYNASPGNLDELKTTLANAKDPKIRAILQTELDRITNLPKGDAGGATKVSTPREVVRNLDGTLSFGGQGAAKPDRPPTGFAADVLGAPTSIAAQKNAERVATGAARTKQKTDAQASFEKDKGSLAPKDLLEKYGQGNMLTDAQKAVLFKIRNQGSRYSK